MKMQMDHLVNKLINDLPSIKDKHVRSSEAYSDFSKELRYEIEKIFNDPSEEKKSFGPFGEIVFPYFRMGNKSSLDLFDLDEMIIFSFYWANRNRYKRVLDIGANIGLHSLILSKCGYIVNSFEPDPVHFGQLCRVLKINEANQVNPHQGAVSATPGEAEFVRVLGNTTSSHLAGCKQPYGDLERFAVKLYGIRDIIREVDLIKMDVEGHEDKILLATMGNDWKAMDAIVEIGGSEKAALIFNHFKNENVNLFAQKIGWEKVTELAYMPMSYKEGSLFITKKSQMPWG